MSRCTHRANYVLVLISMFILTFAGAKTFAQANSDLTGIVTDQSGAVVAGATITLTDPATGFEKQRKRLNRPVRHRWPEPRNLRPESHREGLSVLRADRHRGQRFLNRCASTSS